MATVKAMDWAVGGWVEAARGAARGAVVERVVGFVGVAMEFEKHLHRNTGVDIEAHDPAEVRTLSFFAVALPLVCSSPPLPLTIDSLKFELAVVPGGAVDRTSFIDMKPRQLVADMFQ